MKQILAAALLAGHWSGAMVEQGQPLDVSFDFTDTGGRFTSLTQSAMDYPLDEVHAKDGAVGFTLGGGIVFDGKLSGDTLSGTFKDGGAGGTFTLHREAATPLPYDVQDATFENAGVALKGTLCLPRGKGRHGAVVLVQGSGPETRWGTNRYIADRLARAGIAALIYDKRGSGESQGDWKTATFEDLARDALAGVDLLRAHADIDPARIGIHGHSQGGAIGPLAAALAPDKIHFIVAEDTFAGTQYAQDLYRVRRAIKELNLKPADEADALRIYALFVDASRGAESCGEFVKASAPYRDTEWYKWMEFPPRDSWVWSWAAKTANFDTLPVWRKVRVPVLLIYGEKDALVPPDDGIALIGAELARANTPYAAFVVPGAVHNLTIQPDANGPFFWWHQAPGVVDTVVDWVKVRTE
jgi:pimeloyl-ACP methyl ester carboxylesterase